MKKFTAQEFKDWFDPKKHIGLKVKVRIKSEDFMRKGIIVPKNFAGKTTKKHLVLNDCENKNKFFSFDDWYLAESKAVIRIIPEVVSCPTQADFDRLMNAYEKRGIRWRAGNAATDCKRCWENYGSVTCVDFLADFSSDFSSDREMGIHYGKRSDFEDTPILSLAEALERMGEPAEEEEQPEAKYQIGDYLKGDMHGEQTPFIAITREYRNGTWYYRDSASSFWFREDEITGISTLNEVLTRCLDLEKAKDPLTREEVREIVREEISALAVSIGRLQHVLITLGGTAGKPFLDAATELLKEVAPEQSKD